jgi:hypothetical protein
VWEQQKLVSLREACQMNCGVAIEPYLRYLMDEGEDLDSRVKQLVDKFELEVQAADLAAH